MNYALKALSVLLTYPSAELQDHAADIRLALSELPRQVRARLDPLLDAILLQDLLELQSGYSELFDRSRSLSLHLFEHVHGDNRERGQAMIDLGRQYAEAGFMLDGNELPDFVPVFLEYAACLPQADMRETLQQPAHVFAALAERLDKRESLYAGVFHAILALARARPDRAAIAEIDLNTPEDDPSRIDDEWEEAPVTFLASGAHEMGGPTGIVAKIRAGNRPVDQEKAK
ncbi:MAG: nitrate reductase molybdenum cofactor assembly chaperone [Novosphingobium sp.]